MRATALSSLVTLKMTAGLSTEVTFRVAEVLAIFVGGEGQPVVSVELDLALLDEVDLLREVTFPVNHVVFVHLDLSQKLDQGPHEFVVLAFPQKLYGIQQPLILVDEYFITKCYRQLLKQLVLINPAE